MEDRPIDVVEALHACYRRCDLVLRSERREEWRQRTIADRCRHCRLTLTDSSASPRNPSYRNGAPQSLTASGTACASGSRSRGTTALLRLPSSPPWPYDGFIPTFRLQDVPTLFQPFRITRCLSAFRPARHLVWHDHQPCDLIHRSETAYANVAIHCDTTATHIIPIQFTPRSAPQ